MPLLHVIVLAVIQGVAEFLPVSSSGHLVVAAALLGSGGTNAEVNLLDVSIVLHFGTLLSILVFYWDRIVRLLAEDRRTLWLLVLGTLPAATLGVYIKKYHESVLGDPLLAGCCLLFNAAMLWYAARIDARERKYQQLGALETLGIGLAQAVAILPGISRSGTTISSGLARGLSRTDAASFSFLLALPAIGGATGLSILDMLQDPVVKTPVSFLVLGAIISFVVGLFSLQLLVRVLERGKLAWFAYWCLFLGLGVIIWQKGWLPL